NGRTRRREFTLLATHSSKGRERKMHLQEMVMRIFDVQGVEIVATRAKVFEFLRKPGNLPQWAHAFVSAEQGRARLETLTRAVDGDRNALDALVRDLQGDVYGLALRMMWNREDAEDATQEILVRVVTRLAQFDFRSRLKTWVYRVAVNYILDVKKSPIERMHLNFERFAQDLAEGLSSDGPADAERSLLTEEVKIGCTL